MYSTKFNIVHLIAYLIIILLQSMRLETLSVLAGYTGGSAVNRIKLAVPVNSVLGQAYGINFTEIEKHENNLNSTVDRNNFTFPLVNRIFKNDKNEGYRGSMNKEITENLLCTHSSKLFSIFIFCVSPCHSQYLRLCGVELLGYLLELSSRQLPVIGSVGRHVQESLKILSYEQRRNFKKIDKNNHENMNNIDNNIESSSNSNNISTEDIQLKIDDTNNQNNLNYKSICNSCVCGIYALTLALDDSSDTVRLAAVQALQLAAPVISEDQDQVINND